MERHNLCQQALSHFVMAVIKRDEAPFAAYAHWCEGVDMLERIGGPVRFDNLEAQELIREARDYIKAARQ